MNRPTPSPIRILAILVAVAALAACGKVPNDVMNLAAFPHQLPEAPETMSISGPVPSWLSGHPIVSDGERIFVADRDNGLLAVLDSETLELLSQIEVGGYPEQLVIGPGGEAWVVSRDDGHVARVPAEASLPDLTVPVGAEPTGVALSVDGNRVYVAVRGSQEIVVLDAADGTELQRVSGGRRMRGLAVSPLGWLGVVMENDGVERFPFASDGTLVIQEERNVKALRTGLPSDAEHGFPARQGTLQASRAVGATINPETGAVLVPHTQAEPGRVPQNEFEVMNQFDDAVDQGSSDGYGGGGSVESNRAFLTPTRPVDTVVTVVDDENFTVISGRFAVQDTVTGEPLHSMVSLPTDVAHHPTHSIALVTGEGTDNVLVLNTLVPDPMSAPIGVIDVGMAPRGVAFSPSGDRAYVLNAHSFTVSEIDMTPFLTMEVLDNNHVQDETIENDGFSFGGADMATSMMEPTEEGAQQLKVDMDVHSDGFVRPLHTAHIREASFGEDPASEAVRRGRRLFFDARNPSVSHAGRFACATCHLEGGDDGLVWVTTGPMQTIQLNGRLAETGPFNWLGTKDVLLDNMDQTIDRMGGDGLADGDLSDLQAFLLDGLRAPVNPNIDPAGLTPIQSEGEALFFDPDVGCASCHSGAQFTDGENYDMQTSTDMERLLREQQIEHGMELPPPGFFNTPSLRGVWRSAPYLHNGSAADLLAAVETMVEESILDDGERLALVEYLKTL